MGLVYRVVSNWNTRAGHTTEQASILFDTSKYRKMTVPLLWFHGWKTTPGSCFQWQETPEAMMVPRRLAQLGCVCMSADWGGPSTWGIDEAHLSVPEALAYLAANYGTTPNAYIAYMTSMGNLTGLNRMWRFPGEVRGAALSIPAINLQGIHDRNILGMEAAIDTAYGSHANYLAGLATHSPALNAAGVASIASRMKCWYSNTDNVTLASEVTSFCASAGIQAINMGDLGHSTGSFDEMEVVEWLYQGARRKS